jgi:hypothetical protein
MEVSLRPDGSVNASFDPATSGMAIAEIIRFRVPDASATKLIKVVIAHHLYDRAAAATRAD